MKPGLIIRAWAKLTGGRVVWLRDFQGEFRTSIAYRDPFGWRWCRAYWYVAVGHVVLLEDGSVHPGCVSSYFKQWMYA